VHQSHLIEGQRALDIDFHDLAAPLELPAVLSVISYRSEAEAVQIANDTAYGLQAYVISADPERAHAVASRLDAGRVLINGLFHEPLAPFGGFKQSGLGREMGVFGLEAHLEPKTVLGRSRFDA
jgi:aldehyde dehydrogenase (NAD+)